VVSNGQAEAAVSFTSSRYPSDLDRLVKRSWHQGTAGTLAIDETGQLFTIVISTGCAWSFRVTESPPGHDPLAGTWRYLNTISRRDAEAIGVRFTVVHRQVRITRAAAIRLYRAQVAATAAQAHVHPHRVIIQEALLAQVHTTNRLVDGCGCWTLVQHSEPPIVADLVFLDAQNGRVRGKATLAW
jgi:hypothetical protein